MKECLDFSFEETIFKIVDYINSHFLSKVKTCKREYNNESYYFKSSKLCFFFKLYY